MMIYGGNYIISLEDFCLAWCNIYYSRSSLNVNVLRRRMIDYIGEANTACIIRNDEAYRGCGDEHAL